jgi:hypothetical protein
MEFGFGYMSKEGISLEEGPRTSEERDVRRKQNTARAELRR